MFIKRARMAFFIGVSIGASIWPLTKALCAEDLATSSQPDSSGRLTISSKPPTINQTTPIEVEWYKPIIGISTNVERSRVIITGRTEPRSKISLASEKIFLVKKDESGLETFNKKDADGERIEIADWRGHFGYELELPFRSAQLVFKVETPDKRERLYQIYIDVSEHEANITNMNIAKVSPYTRRTWGLWGGIGFNFLSYDQETSIPSNLNLQSFELPSLYAKAVRTINKDWAIQVTYNRAPGKTQSSSSVRVSQGTYNWTFYTAEFTYYPQILKFKYRRYFSEIGIQIGGQHHQIPFIARSSASDSNIASVETNEVSMLAAGATWLIHYDRYWMLESFFRYELPVASGDLFKIKPKTAFDASVGLIYKWKPDIRAGLFFYGQWLDYDFTDHRDYYYSANGSSDPYVDGSQSMFFSNIEARIGWEFD